METLTLRLQLRSPFGSPLLGDMLFGQLCWALRNRRGEAHLRDCLAGYTEGRPFAVVSDAMPVGYLSRPALPLSLFPEIPDADRKQIKQRVWLPLAALDRPLIEWLALCLRVVYDAERISGAELAELFDTIGSVGFGRDASIGLGKFAIEPTQEPWPEPSSAATAANACLTLAPCAPQGLGCRTERSYYEVFTRFGRHGDQAVQLGNPFKTPVLLARAGALLTPSVLPSAPIIGQGLGGDGSLSKVIPETVQQGYAPVVAVHLPEEIAA